MTNDLVVEELVKEEKEIVQQVLVESYQQYEHTFANPEFWGKYLEEIIASVDNPYVDKILVAKQDQNILGTVQLFETAEKAYKGMEVPIFSPFIRLLAVHPNARGRGVAQELLKASVRY